LVNVLKLLGKPHRYVRISSSAGVLGYFSLTRTLTLSRVGCLGLSISHSL